MTLAEFNTWVEVDKINPLDDAARIYRPAALITAAMGGKFQDAMDFLSPKPNQTARPLKPVEVVRYPKE